MNANRRNDEAVDPTAGNAGASKRLKRAIRAASPVSAIVSTPMYDPGYPAAQGLYNPANEHDSCGVGFVAQMKNVKSHDIVAKGLEILLNLDHRGAVGADPKAGDGCGMLVQIPHAFLSAEMARAGVRLPEPGQYAAGTMFLPKEAGARATVQEIAERVTAAEGQVFLGWRHVPVDPSGLGESVKPTEPAIFQLFIGRGPDIADQDEFERRLFIIRKVGSAEVYKQRDI